MRVMRRPHGVRDGSSVNLPTPIALPAAALVKSEGRDRPLFTKKTPVEPEVPHVMDVKPVVLPGFRFLRPVPTV